MNSVFQGYWSESLLSIWDLFVVVVAHSQSKATPRTNQISVLILRHIPKPFIDENTARLDFDLASCLSLNSQSISFLRSLKFYPSLSLRFQTEFSRYQAKSRTRLHEPCPIGAVRKVFALRLVFTCTQTWSSPTWKGACPLALGACSRG